MVSTADSESADPGSNPGRPNLLFFITHTYYNIQALVAQWIAHWTSNPEVAGSNPVKSAAHNNFSIRNITFRDGVVGNISACHADARGSIPRRGVSH